MALFICQNGTNKFYYAVSIWILDVDILQIRHVGEYLSVNSSIKEGESIAYYYQHLCIVNLVKQLRTFIFKNILLPCKVQV